MSVKKNSECLTCSQASEDSALDLNQPELFGPLHFASENHIAKPSSANTGPTSQSSTTCERSRQMDLEQLTLSAAASPASLGVKPGSKEVQKMTETSGQRWLPLLKSYNLSGSLARTCADLLSSQWGSSAAYLTWKASAIKPFHLLFQLAPSMPRTDGIGSGLLHTPTSKANQMSPLMKERDPGSWWPTPVSSQRGGRSKASITRGGGPTLQDQVKLWPTPTASDHKGSGPTVIRKDGKNRLNDRLDYATEQREPSGGQLNPTWVEWLMGFPEGWTDLKPSEMPSSRKSLSKSEER